MHRFAIIGCGEAAAYHLEALGSVGTVTAVCDADPSRAEGWAKKTGAKSYEDADTLLQDESSANVIIIATPNGLHAEHCIKALQSGRHVISEAPLCLTTAAAWQMVETEKFCRRKLMVTSLKAYHNPLTAFNWKDDISIRVQVSEPVKEWQQTLFPGGGLLYSGMPTMISALLDKLADAEITQTSLVRQDEKQTERSGSANLRDQQGKTALLQWSTGAENWVEIDSEGQKHRFTEPDETAKVQAYKAFYEECDRVFSERGLSSNLYEALKTVRMLEKIYKPAMTNAS